MPCNGVCILLFIIHRRKSASDHDIFITKDNDPLPLRPNEHCTILLLKMSLPQTMLNYTSLKSFPWHVPICGSYTSNIYCYAPPILSQEDFLLPIPPSTPSFEV